MTKQEEIREGIAKRIHTIERTLAKVMYEQSPINCAWEELNEHFRTLYLQQAIDWRLYLDSRGVVIKVERELPKQTVDEINDIFDLWALRPNYAKELVQEVLNKAGYEAVESLIKKVEDDSSSKADRVYS